jgi:hypothetical protein
MPLPGVHLGNPGQDQIHGLFPVTAGSKL